MNKKFIIDRVPYISDLIYSRVFERPHLIDLHKVMEYWGWPQVVIYCRPTEHNVSTEYKSHKPKDYTDKVLKRHKRIVQAYDDFFDLDLTFIHNRFNFLEDDYEDIKRFVEGVGCVDF